MKTCRKRGCSREGISVIAESLNFCTQCGEKLEELVLPNCGKCGNVLSFSDNYCGVCGTPCAGQVQKALRT